MSNQSDSIKELATALAKAQGVMEGAKKDSLNPHFKNKYADLESVWDAARKPLTDNGLSVVQIPLGMSDRGHLQVHSVLMHVSGEYIGGTIEIPAKMDAQGIGSAITYARRYALAALVGIAPEDDDGNGATGNREDSGNGKSTPPPQRQTTPPASEADNKVCNKLRDTLLDWCTGDETLASEMLKKYSEFEKDGKINSMKWADLANPKYAKWAGSTLGRVEKDIKAGVEPGQAAADDDIPF